MNNNYKRSRLFRDTSELQYQLLKDAELEQSTPPKKRGFEVMIKPTMTFAAATLKAAKRKSDLTVRNKKSSHKKSISIVTKILRKIFG